MENNIIIFNHDKSLFCFIILFYAGTITLSIICYKFFKNVYEGDEENQQNEEENKDEKDCNLFGYTIHINKYDNKNLKLIEKKVENNADNINNDKSDVIANDNEEEKKEKHNTLDYVQFESSNTKIKKICKKTWT